MKSLVLVLLITLVAATLIACGEADSGPEATATPEYAIIALDGATPSADSPSDSMDPTSPLSQEPTEKPSPSPTATTSPTSAPTQSSEPAATGASDPTASATVTPDETDRGEVGGGIWSVALLTVEDMPAGHEWTREVLDVPTSDQSVICGVRDPTDAAAYRDASQTVLFANPTQMVFIQQSITEYVEPGAAQRVLEEMRAYFEAMRTCEDPGQGSSVSPSELEQIEHMEITPLDLPEVGDDRVGYRMVFNSAVPEPQPALGADVLAVRVDRLLIVIGSGNWGDEQPPVDAALIERAVEKVDLALIAPSVPTAPPDAATPTVIADLDVSTITSCEQAAEETLMRIQMVLDIVAPYSFDELSGDEAPPGVDELGLEVQEIERRASEIGCEAAEYGALVANGIDPLAWSSPTAQLFAEALRAEYLDFTFSEVTEFE